MLTPVYRVRFRDALRMTFADACGACCSRARRRISDAFGVAYLVALLLFFETAARFDKVGR
jgi:hypothetical protein